MFPLATYVTHYGNRPDTLALNPDTTQISAPPPPVPLRGQTWRMDPAEKMRMRAAAFRATRLYPGPVGELAAREILAFEELGQALGRDGLVMRAVQHILTTPLEPCP